MTDEIHSCSYYCDRPACIKAKRDELVRKYVETPNGRTMYDEGYDHGYNTGYIDGQGAGHDYP